MYVIGLDVGSSGMKSTLFDEHANVIDHAYREYDLICEQEGWYELNPNLILESALSVLKESTRRCKRSELKAICVTSFGESFVCLDAQNKVLNNTMMYMDIRGVDECEEYRASRDEKELFFITGQGADKMFALFKLRWLSKFKSHIIEKTKKICFITDFITHMLGAEHICEYSLAARSALFDIKEKKWNEELVNYAGIRTEMLPNTVPSGTVTGTMSSEIAECLGLSKDVQLIVGGHDQIFAAIGSGANQSGDVANGLGTVDCMISVINGLSDMEKLMEYNFQVVPFVGEDCYVTYAFNMSGGCTVKWFRDTMAKDIANLPDAYDRLDESMPNGVSNMFFVPFLAGGGTPNMDSQTPALLAGMRLGTSRGDIFKAFLEGEAFEMRRVVDCMQDAGVDIKRIITVGGGAKSKKWMQIRADIFNKKVLVPQNREAGTIGSAILCYVNTGIYSSVSEAQKDLIQYNESVMPRCEFAEKYEVNFKKYRKLYQAYREFSE